MKNPVMTIKMKTQNTIKIELFPQITPNTVNSVIHLANEGMYNGRTFYRIVKDFVLQTGCEKKDSSGRCCNYILDGEYKESGYDILQPSFEKGMVGMAGLGGQSNVSDGSSFFIMTGEFLGLDGNFSVIGKVIEGMDEVDRLNNVSVDNKMYGNIKIFQPLSPEIIETVTVETFGIQYPKPKTKPFNEPYIKMERELEAIRSNIEI